MATITITIPDAQLQRVINGLCVAGRIPATPANAKQVVLDYIKGAVLNAEQLAAVQALPPGPDPGLS
jgi:hypothetical protein